MDLIAAPCFETEKRYIGNIIDEIKHVYDAAKCQQLCQEHSQCKFWTLKIGYKCWRQTENAPTVVGTCEFCVRGPRFCSGTLGSRLM